MVDLAQGETAGILQRLPAHAARLCTGGSRYIDTVNPLLLTKKIKNGMAKNFNIFVTLGYTSFYT